ncbi:MAG: YihY/virulence factor BrkB family protein [Opitutaceae bacterium]|nr:YihY/virulence factor BrkB family protein [Opitutaceae bacterium]
MNPSSLLKKTVKKGSHFISTLRRDLWKAETLGDKTLKGRGFSLLRILSITWTGLIENKMTSRASALSYSSLLGLGPMVAIAVLFSGMVLERSDPQVAVQSLNKALHFIAPQLAQYENLEEFEDSTEKTSAQEPQQQSAVVNMLNEFIEGSRSKAVGIAGLLVLIVIVIQLFTSVENAFNNIWGVRRGRNWLLRIVFYWTAITLGAVLVFAGLTMLSAAALASILQQIPGGTLIRYFLSSGAPLISLFVLVGLLTLFYRFIPNTNVYWIPAIIGATVVIGLLYLNNLLAFLYFRRVLLSHSLYGSLGIVPILMVGLFIFWFIVLLGGQITYAIQNADSRSGQTAWNDLSQESREHLSLLILVLVCRRFKECADPYTASELTHLTRIPTQILNESLNRLVDLKFLTNIPPSENETSLDHHFQPALPLENIHLEKFSTLFSRYGGTPGEAFIENGDPIVTHFREKRQSWVEETFGTETMASLIEQLQLPSSTVTS